MQRTGLAGGGPDSAGERIRMSSAATGHDTLTRTQSIVLLLVNLLPLARASLPLPVLRYLSLLLPAFSPVYKDLIFPTSTSSFFQSLRLFPLVFPPPSKSHPLFLSTFSLLCTLQQPWLWIGNGNRR